MSVLTLAAASRAVAVVGDSLLLEWATGLADRVSHPDVEYFEADAITEAWTWVEAPCAEQA